MRRVASFDFDKTLAAPDGKPIAHMLKKLLEHHLQGDECHIVTSRTKSHETKKWRRKNEPERTLVKEFVDELFLPIVAIHFTAHEPKGGKLKEIGAYVHYDDDEDELCSARDNGVVGIQVNETEVRTWKE